MSDMLSIDLDRSNSVDLDKGRMESPGPSEERVEIFKLNGESYTIPRKPKVNIALRYLREVRTLGQELAVGKLLEDMLGIEGYNALMEYEELTAEQLQQVILVTTRIVMGSLEGSGKGKR